MLTKAEQRVLVWLEAGDFDNTGCRHGQETIAVGAQCTVRTVIRATKRLRDLGLITINKERRPGCKWLCNVYHVRHWNPRKRSGVLNILAARREAKCHAEGKATAARAQTSAVNPSFVASNVLPGRSRARASRDFEIRRLRMDQRRRHLHVADLTCLHCTEKDAELARKDEIIHRLSVLNTELAEELSGARTSLGVAGKAITALEQRIVRQARRSVRSEQVEAVIEHWKKHRPKTKASSFPPGGRNWQTIEKALGLMAENEDGPVKACCEAIDGLHIAPWEAYGKRYMREAQGRTLRNRLEHALGDECRIERCRGIVRRIRQDGADRAWELYQVAEATYWALTELTLEQLGERRRGPVEPAEKRFEVDGLLVREDGR